MRIEHDKGTALFLSLIIMGALLTLGLGLIAILVGQLRITRGMEESVLAIFAADTGIEEVLMSQEGPFSSCTPVSPCNLPNGTRYFLEVTPRGGTTPRGEVCNAKYFCIRAVGMYRSTRRAIEINY